MSTEKNYYEILKMNPEVFTELNQYDLYVLSNKANLPKDMKKPSVVIVGTTAYIINGNGENQEIKVDGIELYQEEMKKLNPNKQGEVNKNKAADETFNNVMERIVQKKIRSQYKILALFCHPDKSGQNQVEAGNQFKLLNEANEVLSNSDARHEHNNILKLSLDLKKQKRAREEYERLHPEIFSAEALKASRQKTPIVQSIDHKTLFQYVEKCNKELTAEFEIKKQSILSGSKNISEISDLIPEMEEMYETEKAGNKQIASYSCTAQGGKQLMFRYFRDIYDELKIAEGGKVDLEQVKKHIKNSLYNNPENLHSKSIAINTSPSIKSNFFTKPIQKENTERAIVLVGEVDYSDLIIKNPLKKVNRIFEESAPPKESATTNKYSYSRIGNMLQLNNANVVPQNSALNTNNSAKNAVVELHTNVVIDVLMRMNISPVEKSDFVQERAKTNNDDFSKLNDEGHVVLNKSREVEGIGTRMLKILGDFLLDVATGFMDGIRLLIEGIPNTESYNPLPSLRSFV